MNSVVIVDQPLIVINEACHDDYVDHVGHDDQDDQ